MKINFSTLVRTNLGFPSEWIGFCENDNPIKISYRIGRVKVFHNNELYDTLSLDEFDVGGYMDDKTLKTLLFKHGLL